MNTEHGKSKVLINNINVRNHYMFPKEKYIFGHLLQKDPFYFSGFQKLGNFGSGAEYMVILLVNVVLK